MFFQVFVKAAALEYISAFEQVWSHSATAVTMEYVNTTDRF
ncbi:hypothetical protein T07_12152 [Trichinella nelsoni]|uniref:Uncharacterized protein n=1 Tax=Trichinella nelsoni TaxID=6336 RepID=A0A0V0RER0_9BILA|nr:hypothetical protein T07_12152 [Trichinella nelsoni]